MLESCNLVSCFHNFFFLIVNDLGFIWVRIKRGVRGKEKKGGIQVYQGGRNNNCPFVILLINVFFSIIFQYFVVMFSKFPLKK